MNFPFELLMEIMCEILEGKIRAHSNAPLCGVYSYVTTDVEQVSLKLIPTYLKIDFNISFSYKQSQICIYIVCMYPKPVYTMLDKR